ncbi:MAG: hypothetical protein GQE15_16315 [Archangiaceae bacterium]|nr:hypothetical protein [Archangiaceae bacterium]
MRRWSFLMVAVLISRTVLAAEELPPGLEPIVVGPKPMVVLPPPVKRPINWEPFILTGAGTIMLGIGVWRLVAAEADYQALRAFPTTPGAGQTNDQALTQARTLVQSGKLNTGLGWTLVGLGVASVGASLGWLFVEGLEKDPLVLFSPVPGGAAAVVSGRF